MKKLLITIVLLFVPTYAFAAGYYSYNESLNHINNYIISFKKHDDYLVLNNSNYIYNNGVLGSNSNFIKSGYLNTYEYEVIGGKNSYLFDGDSYYTMTDGSSTNLINYIVDSETGKDVISKTSNNSVGIRSTQHIKNNVKINGIGTYTNPWYFDGINDVVGPVISFSQNSDVSYSKSKTVNVTAKDEDTLVLKNQKLKYTWVTGSCPINQASYTNNKALSNVSEDIQSASASVSLSGVTGLYRLCIASGVLDTSGNSSVYSQTSGLFALDNTPPKINAYATVNNTTGTINVSSITENESGFNSYYYGYSTSSSCTPTIASTSASYGFGFSDGTYYLCVKADDKAGNISDVITTSVTISTKLTCPELAISFSCVNGSVGSSPYKMSYSGRCEISCYGNDYKVEFLTSGTLVFTKATDIDVFLVGGGGGGSSYYGAGGAGGYTRTYRGISLAINTGYYINIGNGGYGAAGEWGTASAGGTSTAFGYSASGGGAARSYYGGTGGSGGAAWNRTGGSDGNNGPSSEYGTGGYGQGTTTREFGEASGKLYAGGGGGEYNYAGPGGGGAGLDGPFQSRGDKNGTANLGGGGGGADGYNTAGSGGSGIVVIRNKR